MSPGGAGASRTTVPEVSGFLSGVIEGFYGKPWTAAERIQLFDWMAAWGLNTYLYAPKDDLHHRTLWREPYGGADAIEMRRLIEECRARNLRFVYGLSPGLDIRYALPGEIDHLRVRFVELLGLGCTNFTLLFDDIPDVMDGGDVERWGSLAAAQCHVTNAMLEWTRARRQDARLFFCPTAYCGRMAAAKLGGEGYLATVGRELLPAVGVFWTGPDIVSREIGIPHVREIAAVLRRKPIIWDNLHANDYDGRRFYCGPYSGRPPELRDEVGGLLTNPNTEFPLNYVPLRTFAQFVGAQGAWDARSRYMSALNEWAPSFDTVHGPAAFHDLVLFGDSHYLPYSEGPEAESLYRDASRMVATPPDETATAAFLDRAGRLRAFCASMANLRSRPLFHALSRRTWELREELDLLERFAHEGAASADGVGSDFHLPRTFRGGLVARLQQLLVQGADGRFTAADSRDVRGGKCVGPGSQPRLAPRRKQPKAMSEPAVRPARPGDEAGAYHVCLKTGDHGEDGEQLYGKDPDALGRLFVGPYMAFEPELSVILEDTEGVCGYALGALDSHAFYARYEAEWRHGLCAHFPAPQGDPSSWTPLERLYQSYHQADYFCPEPYDAYPSHLHIDLLPRAQGHGHGRRMLEQVMDTLRWRGSPGAHVGVSAANTRAQGFYVRLGFRELVRVGKGHDSVVYMGKELVP